MLWSASIMVIWKCLLSHPPLLLMGREGQRIRFSKQGVGVTALGVTPESQGKICSFDKSMSMHYETLFISIST